MGLIRHSDWTGALFLSLSHSSSILAPTYWVAIRNVIRKAIPDVIQDTNRDAIRDAA